VTFARRFTAAAAHLTLLLAAGSLFLPGCTLRSTRPAARPLSVFVSSWTGPDQLPAEAALVKNAKATEPCVWLILGNPFSETAWTELTDGAAQVALLNAAGVDALLLEPSWLAFGPERTAQLISGASFYVLGANLLDSLQDPIGQPFLVKTLAGTNIGFTGVWLDSSAPHLASRSVRYTDPDFAVSRTLPLIRARTSLAGVIAPSAQNVPGWGADIIIGAAGTDVLSVTPPSRGLARLSLQIESERIVEYRLTEPVPGMLIDAPTKAVLDSVHEAIGPLGAAETFRLTRALHPAAAARSLAQHALRNGADALLSDEPLLRDSLGPGPVTRRRLVETLTHPGRLYRTSLTGARLKQLLADRTVQIEWRTGLRNQRLALNRNYEILSPPHFFSRRLRPLDLAYDCQPEPFWKLVASGMSGTGDKAK